MNRESMLLKIWRIVYPMLIYLGISYIFSMAAMVLIGVKIAFSADSQMTDVNAISELLVNEIYKYSMLITLISGAIATPVLYLFYHWDKKRNVSHVKFSKPSVISYLYIMILATVACMSMNNLITMSNIIELFPGFEEISKALYGGNIIIEVLAAVIMAPIVEELLFRGLIYKRLRSDMKPTYAIVISAFLFGVYHMNVVQGLYAFGIGLLLGYVFEKYKSLIAPILFHIIANGISVIMSESSALDFLYSSNFMILLSTAIEIVVGILIIAVIRKKVNLARIDRTIAVEVEGEVE